MIRNDFKKFNKEVVDLKKTKKEYIMKNLLMASDSGKVFVYGIPPYLKENLECDVFNTHFGAITCMKVHYDSSLVVTAGKDGSIFVYRVN
jgi:WD40 repeat protein